MNTFPPITFPALGLLSSDNISGRELQSQGQEKHFEADQLGYRSIQADLYSWFFFQFYLRVWLRGTTTKQGRKHFKRSNFLPTQVGNHTTALIAWCDGTRIAGVTWFHLLPNHFLEWAEGIGLFELLEWWEYETVLTGIRCHFWFFFVLNCKRNCWRIKLLVSFCCARYPSHSLSTLVTWWHFFASALQTLISSLGPSLSFTSNYLLDISN